ncbi:restriction endonuclease [Gimesia chilikensis]|uniref:restriction endonuclease n=1 Tax=Gimesia chilikensis TaxID=2605989 RepID=UPI003A8EACFF
MPDLSLRQVVAHQPEGCSFCNTITGPGELFWAGSIGNLDLLTICTKHAPLNTKGYLSSEDLTGIIKVKPISVNVRKDLIPLLQDNPDGIYDITSEEFEELVFDRILAMGFQGFRTGASNRKDGGIDIVAWTLGLFPMLCAVQIKHRQSPKKRVGVADIREFTGAMHGRRINMGLVVTNTAFTQDARHLAMHGTCPIQLRGIDFLRKWIADDFSVEKLDFESRRMELCKGISIDMPHFG